VQRVAGKVDELADVTMKSGGTSTTFSRIKVDHLAQFMRDAAGNQKAEIDTFQFALLPDFEEQIAIKDNNFAAYGKYELKFADGWQLRSVSGTWDSTEVAIKALQTLGKAVKALAEVRQAQLGKVPKEPEGHYGDRAQGRPVLIARVCSTFIEPGMYRLQKSSERSAGTPCNGSELILEHGILTELGLCTKLDINTIVLTD
jgi:hypothetical protein